MSKKFVLLLSFIIFIIAFFVRYASYSDYQQPNAIGSYAVEKLYTSTFGMGTDPEYQVHCALSLDTGKPNSEVLTHYDYLFMCPTIALFLKWFGFIRGLNALAIMTIIIGAAIATAPFLFFSILNKFSLGGLIASLFLSVNPILIFSSSGRLIIYNLTTLTFTIFYIFFFLSLNKKRLIWLVLLGIAGLIEGLNKPFLQINDIPFLFIFAFLYPIKKFSFNKKFPYFIVQIDTSLKIVLQGFIPFFIIFVGSVGYEFIHYALTQQPSYLGDTFVKKTPGDLKEQMLSSSLLYKGPLTVKVKNIISLLIVGLLRLLNYTQIPQSLFVFVIIILAFVKKKSLRFLLLAVLGLFITTGLLYFLAHFLLRPNVIIPDINVIRFNSIFFVSLVLTFIFLFAFRSTVLLGLVLIQAAYLFSLSMTLVGTSQIQLFVTLIIWVCLFLGACIDFTIQPIIQKLQPRVYKSLLFVILGLAILASAPTFMYSFDKLYYANKEHMYLHWVKTQIPSNGYILGGANDNLIWLSQDVQRTIFYNVFGNAWIIKPNATVFGIEEFPPTERFPAYIKNHVTTEESENNFYVLDEGLEYWHNCLTISYCSETYPLGKYRLVLFAKNKVLNRSIFKIVLKPQDSSL